MRSLLFLIFALFISVSNTHLQAQESSFAPGEITSEIDSAAVATPSLFDQQAVDTELDASNAIFNEAPVTETVTLPDTITYSETSFAGSNDVQFSQTSPAPRSGTWWQRANEHLRRASIDAPSEGITLSLLGGPSYAGDRIDDFGRTIGEAVTTGDTLGFSVGKRFTQTFRIDLELSWRKADQNGYLTLPATPSGIPFYKYESELKNFSGMANFYYDFHRASGSFLTPYIGLGLGTTKQEFLVNFDSTSLANIEESDTGFAVQGMIGVSANITVHNELFVEQRSFSITENNYSATTNGTIFGWRHTF